MAQIQGHKPSALAEKHYRRRPLDMLRMWHDKIEVWMLEQAEISLQPTGPIGHPTSEKRIHRQVWYLDAKELELSSLSGRDRSLLFGHQQRASFFQCCKTPPENLGPKLPCQRPKSRRYMDNLEIPSTAPSCDLSDAARVIAINYTLQPRQ